MNRRVGRAEIAQGPRRGSCLPPSSCSRLRTLRWVLGACFLLALLGCTKPQVRSQAADESEKDHYEMKTVGDITTVVGLEPIAVGGVGVVVELDGTGGEAAMDGNRQTLEDQLRKKGIKNIKELMTSPYSALVLVSGYVQPGSRKGDRFDIEVKLPPQTRATSLRGGKLMDCVLYSFDYTQRLKPDLKSNRQLQGPRMAIARGQIQPSCGEGDEGVQLKRGVIWNGARSLEDSSICFLLDKNNKHGTISLHLENRINAAFGAIKGSSNAIAGAHRDVGVFLRVPAAYKLNVARFVLVARMVPYNPSAGPDGDLAPYRRKLADDLADPSRTGVAALRLEALGQNSIPILKKGLDSSQQLVRFCSAEALAYLGCPSAAEELAQAVAKEPELRAFGLTALASLGESSSRIKLQELLTTSNDDETRYGAFRALRMMDEQDKDLQGEYLGESFWLHQVAPHTTPLVHYVTMKRAEIVFFGPEPVLLPDFSYLAGDYVISAGPEDDKCTVSRINPHGAEPTRKQCSLKLGTVLRTLADLGAGYSEVTDLMRQAHETERLSCRLRRDAVPQATTGGTLEFEGSEATATALGATPTLFNLGLPKGTPSSQDEPGSLAPAGLRRKGGDLPDLDKPASFMGPGANE